MKSLAQFGEDARNAGLHLKVDSERLDRVARVSDEDALFHVPLLALCILMVARTRTKALLTADVGAWVGATLTRHFSRKNSSNSKLAWSFPHRRRCAEALVFLEDLQLVVVEGSAERSLKLTQKGTETVRTFLSRPDDVGALCQGLVRAYRTVEHHGLQLL